MFTLTELLYWDTKEKIFKLLKAKFIKWELGYSMQTLFLQILSCLFNRLFLSLHELQLPDPYCISGLVAPHDLFSHLSHQHTQGKECFSFFYYQSHLAFIMDFNSVVHKIKVPKSKPSAFHHISSTFFWGVHFYPGYQFITNFCPAITLHFGNLNCSCRH